MRKQIFIFSVVVAFLFFCSGEASGRPIADNDNSAFVVVTDVIPDAELDIRYFTTYNFTGDRVPGYDEPVALLTREAADSLRAVSNDLRAKGYRIKIFDAYRPQCAVDFFMKWAQKPADVRMKKDFYPEIGKAMIIPQGYVARKSGHTRGSTIDLTIVDIKSGEEVDMGSPFDYFGTVSHATIQPGQKAGAHKPISKEQYRNRMILRQAMTNHGFRPYNGEWWHFTLRNEPFPSTYFSFPVKRK